jgi:hypothetical protein
MLLGTSYKTGTETVDRKQWRQSAKEALGQQSFT